MNYLEWTEALAGYFFAASRANISTPFFVDEDALEEIAGAEALEDLVDAVGVYLVEGAGNPYKNILARCRSWERSGDEAAFPGLPLLAIAVLAATRMAREADVQPHNYYTRYRQLLGIGGQGAPPGYADTFPQLWAKYSSWLNSTLEGSLGRSTAKKHPHFTNIGYALSQALFRDSDRQRLTEFFHWLEIEPEEEIEDEELLTFFGVWVGREHRVSRGCARMLEDEAYRLDLLEILREELDRWEGLVIDDAGRRVAQIVPVVQLGMRTSLRLLARCPQGFPRSGSFRLSSGLEITLDATGDGWYEPAIEASAAALSNGLSLVADGYRLTCQGEAVVPLRQDPTLGVWTAARTVTPDEPHLALVELSQVASVRGFLLKHADEPVNERPVSADGWSLFGPFAISHAILDTPSAELERLVPSIRDRPSLMGGLQLAHQLYLVGGEPDLWIAPSDSDRSVTIEGHREVVSAAGGRIRLRELGLEEGSHEIAIGPSRLSIETIETRGSIQPRGTGSLAWELDPDQGHPPTGTGPAVLPDDDTEWTLAIRGPSILGHPDSVPEHTSAPLILKGGKEYIVLGAVAGEIVRPTPPPTPRWMANLKLVPYGFEFTPAFEAAWVLILQVHRWRPRDTGLDRSPTQVTGATAASEIADWAEVFSWKDVAVQPADAARWGEFTTFARNLRAP